MGPCSMLPPPSPARPAQCTLALSMPPPPHTRSWPATPTRLPPVLAHSPDCQPLYRRPPPISRMIYFLYFCLCLYFCSCLSVYLPSSRLVSSRPSIALITVVCLRLYCIFVVSIPAPARCSPFLRRTASPASSAVPKTRGLRPLPCSLQFAPSSESVYHSLLSFIPGSPIRSCPVLDLSYS